MDVFDNLNTLNPLPHPQIDYYGNSNAMKYSEIQSQICPGGNPGTPFIFIDQLSTALGPVYHTNVVKGFYLDATNLDATNKRIQFLKVDTHELGDIGYIEYDCGYVEPLTCGKGYDRYADVYDIKLVVPPAIAASPASLSFTAQQGGANPAAQTLSISNTGGGTLSWSATDSVAWLTLSPVSGTGNGPVTLSATTGTLTAGSYSGTVTLSATGASPVTVPVTFTVTPPKVETVIPPPPPDGLLVQ